MQQSERMRLHRSNHRTLPQTSCDTMRAHDPLCRHEHCMSVCLATRCTHIGTVQLGTTWNMSATYSEHAALGSPSFGWRPMMRTTVTTALKLEALKLTDAIAKTPEPGGRRNTGAGGVGRAEQKCTHGVSFSCRCHPSEQLLAKQASPHCAPERHPESTTLRRRRNT